jgi:pyruvate dehydrogenase E2 component (dihydrolipoamide acetyltransferase)
MPIAIEMPKLSDTMTEGTLVKWIKKVGDIVAVGDVLAEVETDKATMEMEAFDEGVLSEIYVKDGEKVEIGQKLDLIRGRDEHPAADT